jgi:hypothetical protein
MRRALVLCRLRAARFAWEATGDAGAVEGFHGWIGEVRIVDRPLARDELLISAAP